ncbi:Small ribosomal subunit protein mS47 [Cardamine amara subsp. amara]|uniref:3-hydroxyisobutyryl-CoA hydrolase n=1 Tax=Cardamine amara subsp. amara TaxID=228776 RepID=A0ABD1AUI5_CARAN
MQTLKALRRVSEPLQWVRSISYGRSFSALPNYSASDVDIEDQVLVEGKAKSRAAILNCPSSLNALSAPMVGRLKRLYESWEENPAISFVMMKGSGKTFCSGADVLPLYHWVKEGNIEECKHYFDNLYKFVYLQGTYLKPNIAIMDGVTMGCGGGISIPGMFRVATDKTVLAHPEVQIGFHPDAGASYYLSRLPGYLGEYLALTGQKLNGVEMIACGLATHYCLNSRLPMIEERIGKLLSDDPAVIEDSLAQYGDLVYPDTSSALHKIEMIDKYFGLDTVEEIIEAMENEVANSCNEWCKKTLKQIKEASPLSLKITLKSIREGRFQTLDQCLTREYYISVCGVSAQFSGDFCEGIRARLVDKDFAPKWNPPRLEDVSDDTVECYFHPCSDDSDSELILPTAQREPFF